MKHLNIDTPHGLIRISVLNNDFTVKYFAMFQQLIDRFPLVHSRDLNGVYFNQLAGDHKQHQTFDRHMEIQAQRLQEIIDEINDMGCNFPYAVDVDVIKKKNLETQQLVNRFHRAFTTADRCYGQNTPMVWSDQFPSTFVVPEGKMPRFIELIDQINVVVHHGIELYTVTPRKVRDMVDVPWQYRIWANSWIPGSTQLVDTKTWADIMPEDHKYFSDSKEFDVWVGKDILGKDHITAYYDHDDASEWDVTPIVGYSGKIAMDVSDLTRSDLVRSEPFQAWLDECGEPYTPAMCGMPLGTIIEGRDIARTLFATYKEFTPDNMAKISITIE